MLLLSTLHCDAAPFGKRTVKLTLLRPCSCSLCAYPHRPTPERGPNERTWIEFLRYISNELVPTRDSLTVLSLQTLIGG